MEKDKIFFGKDGMTQTSANYIANLAKEMYQRDEEALNSVVFYTTKVKLLGTSEEDVIRKGLESTVDIPIYLERVAKCKALIAWLREAIKAKTRLLEEANKATYETYNLVCPEMPVREAYLTDDEYISKWNIKQRNRYYYLEAFCSTVGEYIHPEGAFSTEREQLNKVINNPNEVQGSGRDTLIYSRTPSINPQEVEDTFMKLQNTHREYQAELNSMKHELLDALNKDKLNKDMEYSRKMKEYKNQMSSIDAELLVLKKKSVEEISNYKIILPDSLKSIYEEVQSLGKK